MFYTIWTSLSLSLLLLLLFLLTLIIVCEAREVLPPSAYVNRTMYPSFVKYQNRPLLSIGVLTDIQYDDHEEFSRRYFRLSPMKVEHAVNEMNANRSHLDLVIHLGDTIDNNIETNLPIINAHLKRLNFPFFQMLGNHDFYLTNEGLRKENHEENVHHLLGMPAPYYSLRAGENQKFLLIVLDSTDLSIFATKNGSPKRLETENFLKGLLRRFPQRRRSRLKYVNGGISKEQMKWLGEQLEYAMNQSLVVLIFSHIPMYPFGGVLNLWNDIEVVQLISKFPCVAGVISGHTHRWEYNALNVTHYDGNFTIHFISYGGIVQSPFTSWGFLEVYEKYLHAHGLTFGRAFSFKLPINMKVLNGMVGVDMSDSSQKQPKRELIMLSPPVEPKKNDQVNIFPLNSPFSVENRKDMDEISELLSIEWTFVPMIFTFVIFGIFLLMRFKLRGIPRGLSQLH